VRARLSLTWTVSVLAAALLPLAAAGFATLKLVERSTLEAAERLRRQVGEAGAAVIRDHLDDARNKLCAMAALLREGEDPEADPRALDRLLAPQDVFLEIGVRRLGFANDLRQQRQTVEFNASQVRYFGDNRPPPNLNFDAALNQFVEAVAEDDPRIARARAGQPFVGSELERAGEVGTLGLSAPTGTGDVLLARLDLAPVQGLLASLCGAEPRGMELLDARPGADVLLVAGAPSRGDDALETFVDVGHGGWRLRVSEPRSRARAPIGEAHYHMAHGFGAAVVLCILLSLLFARRVVAPVRELARSAERFGGGDFTARSGIERTDEIGQLAAAFDRMAESLSELDRLKSEFVAHVSHELRTPLTSAKLTLANVEEGIAGPEALARVRKDLDRLVRLVDELLDLARIDAGIDLARTPVRLEEAAEEAAQSLAPLARVPIAITGRSEELRLDRARLHQVIVNLLDNALKHARSRVRVEIGPRELAVTDDGPGVPAEERERVFERFVRLDPAGKGPGGGLGLSIARKLVELHGGTLHCTGSTFVVRF
jgi:signal transduction histidine kinase